MVTITAGQCTTYTACSLSTSILPQHGVGIYSATDVVSNSLGVAASGAASATAGTYSMAVSAYPAFATPGIAPAPLPVPNFAQMMYVAGTDGTSGATTYKIAVPVTASTGEDIHSVLITLPPGIVGSNVTITYVCSPAVVPASNCATGPGNWTTMSPAVAGLSNTTPNEVYMWDFGCTNGSNTCGITKGATADFIFSVDMGTQTDTYADTALVANPDGGCPASAGGFCSNPLAALTYDPSAGTANSPVNADGSNLDKTEMGVFSLDPTLMSVLFSPATIGAVATTTTLNFINTTTSESTNPDYVDEILLSVPNGAIPNSITIPATSPYSSTWTVTKMAAGPPATWKIVDNCLTACYPGNVTNALAPGATIPLQFNYTAAPTTGNYTVTWYALGANGNVYSSAGTSALQVNSTSAIVQFEGAGGPPNAPDGTVLAPIPVVGSQPFVGSDATAGVGSVFDYRITNNGSTAITTMTIAVPYVNTFSVTPNNNTWAVPGSNVFYVQPTTSALYKPTLSGTGAGTCTVGALTQDTGTANGSIPITCTTGFTNGQFVDVRFVMEVPYDIGSNYVFSTTLNGAVQGTPSTTLATTLGIQLDAMLTMLVPVSGGTSTISRPETGGTATSTCLGCTITASSGALPATINFGAFAGTFNGTNLVNASVTSDASGAHGWNLYVSVDNNPNNFTSGTPLLQGSVNSANSSANAAYAITPAIKDTLINLPVDSPAPSGNNPNTALLQQLATFTGGTLSRKAVDTVMNFRVSGTGDLNTARTVVVTYTLVPN